MPTPILTKNDSRLNKFKHKNAMLVKMLPDGNFTVVDCDDVNRVVRNMIPISRIEVIRSGMTRSQRKLQLCNMVAKANADQIIAFCNKFGYKILNSPHMNELPALPVVNAQPTIIPADRPLREVIEGDDKCGPLMPYKPVWRRKSYDKKDDKRISIARYKTIRNILERLSVALNENFWLRIGSTKCEVVKNDVVDITIVITRYCVQDLKKAIEQKYAVTIMEDDGIVSIRLKEWDNAIVEIMEDFEYDNN